MKTKFIGVPILIGNNISKAIMRGCIILFCLVSMGFTPKNIFSQNTRIVIDADKEVSVEEVFDLITKQTDYNFIYKTDMFLKAPKVRLQKGSIKINELLKKSLSYDNFEYTFSKNGSILLEKNEASSPVQQSIAGTVKDANGAPLVGANVVVKGTTRGTQTDFDGNYVIEAGSDDTLMFSYIGFSPQEIAINGRTTLDVILAEDTAALEEVVVLGYATQTRGDLTGSVSSVDVAQATKTPIVNAAEALEGRVTGVTVINNSGPGQAPTVRIRGYGTSNSNNPLYIIDGVQTDDPSILNSINAADIEQMNVLKDGAAAIYGARASNGVVIITTKSGGYNMDKATVSVDMYTGFSKASNLPELLNTQQYADFIWQSLKNDGAELSHPQFGTGPTPVIPDKIQNIPVSVTANKTGTKWLDEMHRTALTQNASVTLQNGTSSGKYLMSLGYLNRQGIELGTGFKRGTARLNSEFKLPGNIRVGEHINLSFSNRKGSDQSEFLGGLQMSPLLPVYADDGSYTGSYVPAANVGSSENPVSILKRASDDYRKSIRMFGDVYASVDIADGLTIKTSAGGDILALNDRQFLALNPEHAEARSVASLAEEDFVRYEWVWNNTLNFNKTYGEHSINAVAGIEALKNGQKGKTVSRTNYLFETPDYYLLTNGSGAPIFNSAYDGSSSLFSIFGTANYSFKNKYLFTGTLRRDKSSRFKGDNQSDIFPSFSAGWVLSNEEFFPEGVVSRVKFFGSWGQLGNQSLPVGSPTVNISNLGETLANYSFSGTASSIRTGAYLSQVGNPNLKWETSETTNLGLDLGFFDDKLLLTVEYFNITTKDLISQDFSLINTTAIDAAAPYVNLGSFKNTGLDLSLGYQNSTDSGWSYGFQANISHYKNEVTELISDFVLGRSEFRGGAVTRTQVGQPLSSFYGRVVEGIFASEAEVSSHADQGFTNASDGVGRFKYKDVNNDGVITDEDRTFIGSPHPDFVYGVNLNLGYKGFDISAFISGSQGNDIYNYNKIYTDLPTFYNTNRSVRVLDAWRPDNLDATIPKPGLAVPNNETQPNSFFVEDGSYMRLKNLQIGYALPNKIMDKLGMDTLRFYLQGTNLFTLTDYDGQDPELGPRNGGDNLTISVDDVHYSTAQIFTLGFNLKF